MNRSRCAISSPTAPARQAPQGAQWIAVLLGTVGLVGGVAGCSSGPAKLTMTPAGATANDRKAHAVFESFPGAYITSNHDGEYDILLVSDAFRSPHAVASAAPLRPQAQPPVHQAVRIHVFWKPTSGAIVHETSITNATIDWYVLGNANPDQLDMVHYHGAGFVKLDVGSKSTEVEIGDAQLAPKAVRGRLSDPIGPARLTGSLTAVRDDQRVRELLVTLQQQTTGDRRYWTSTAEVETIPLAP